MRSIVTIIFDDGQRLEYVVDVDSDTETQLKAVEWLEATWHRLGCEPIRHSGKVLLLDRVLGVAESLGYETFSRHAEHAEEFATQTAMALGRPRITIDVPGHSVGF